MKSTAKSFLRKCLRGLKISRNSGITLIELILTITLLGILSVPIALTLNQHVESVAIAEDYSQAINLARFEMEIIQNLDYASVDSVSYSQYQGYDYDVLREVTFINGDDTSAESLKEVRVDVMRAGTLQVVISVKTYLADNVQYGI